MKKFKIIGIVILALLAVFFSFYAGRAYEIKQYKQPDADMAARLCRVLNKPDSDYICGTKIEYDIGMDKVYNTAYQRGFDSAADKCAIVTKVLGNKI